MILTYLTSILQRNRLFLAAVVLGCIVDAARADSKGRTLDTFDLSSGNKKTAVTAASVTPANDKAAMDRTVNLPGDPPETRRQSVVNGEANAYDGTGFTLAPSNLNVNGFNIGTNDQPTCRLNCAGLTFARLLGGPLNLPPAEGFKIADTFGTQVDKGQVRVGDVLFWRDPSGKFIQHFAIVHKVEGSGRSITIVSKDNMERVYVGQVDRFPVEKKQYAAQPVYYHLDWNKIKVTRRLPHPPVVAKTSGKYCVWYTPANPSFPASLYVLDDGPASGGVTKLPGVYSSPREATVALLKLIDRGSITRQGGALSGLYMGMYKGKRTMISNGTPDNNELARAFAAQGGGKTAKK